MNLANVMPIAISALMRNKTRSFLTTLGVIIGVASVISMVAVGEGAKARVSGVFAAMGTNMLIVLSGSTSMGGVSGGFGSLPTLTWEDLKAIRTQAPAVRRAAPAQTIKATIMAEDENWTTTITGTSPEFFDIRSWVIDKGSLFGDTDIQSGPRSSSRARRFPTSCLALHGSSGQDRSHPLGTFSGRGSPAAKGTVPNGALTTTMRPSSRSRRFRIRSRADYRTTS
jgi:hypothetical protein